MHLTIRHILYIVLILLPWQASEAQLNTEQVLRIGANTNYFEDYVLSIKYFNQVIAVNPQLARPYFYRAIAKYNLDDFAGAEEDATLAIERNPFITEAYEVRGVSRQNLGKVTEALADYEKALSIQPENRGILFNKAIAEQELGRIGAADSTFATLLRCFPRFADGYVGRARLELEQKDTVAARSDLNRALELDHKTVNAYIMRADLALSADKDYKQALADMDMAVKLRPEQPGLYINRAYIRYLNDDFHGAFDDYAHAIDLDPQNTVALFNRGLLRAEVHDTNRAIDDFTSVLALEPDNHKTLYNRAILLGEIGDYERALADITRVLDSYPDFAAAYFLRYDLLRRKGDRIAADRDYRKSLDLAKTNVQLTPDKQFGSPGGDSAEQSQEEVKRRFTSLTTLPSSSSSDTPTVSPASEIHGKVQDRDGAVELEPIFILTYYTSPTEIKEGGEYLREVDEVNDLRLLRFVLQVANREAPRAGEDSADAHRESIAFYNSYLATHAPRAVDHFGRAMDFVSLRDWGRALADLDRALELTPDFALASFERANVNYLRSRELRGEPGSQILVQAALRDALADLDRAISLSPNMTVAWFNKGVILAETGDYHAALDAFSRAVDLKPDFGEAYYNRGFVYLTLGDKQRAFPDLSRSGELGVVPSYGLLKRMTAR